MLGTVLAAVMLLVLELAWASALLCNKLEKGWEIGALQDH